MKERSEESFQQLTYTTKQFDTKCSEDEEQKKEEQSEVADFRKCLNDRVEQRANRLGHFEQLQNCNVYNIPTTTTWP